MPKKRRVKRMPATLLALHDRCVPGTSSQSVVDDAGFGQKIDDPFLAIKELEEKIWRNYELSKEREADAPPLLHICVQYCGEVVQSRYERSVFSSIVHEADNIVDKVTGDEDDSDFESLIEVEDNSSVFDGLGITKSKGVPELRILIIKVTNAHKMCEGKIHNAKAIVTYQSGNKTTIEKTKRKEPDYRHNISFNHVFIFRGASIEELRRGDIKLSIKTYSSHKNEESFVILSAGRCVTEDRFDSNVGDEVVTNPLFWKEYLDEHSERLFKYAIPLVCPNKPDAPAMRKPPPSSLPSTPSLPPSEENDSSERTSSSMSYGTDQELAVLKSDSPEGAAEMTSEPPEAEELQQESPEIEIVIAQTEESGPTTTKSPTPSHPTDHKSRSPSPFDMGKPRSRKPSSDSGSNKSDASKKKKFGFGKFTKLFS